MKTSNGLRNLATLVVFLLLSISITIADQTTGLKGGQSSGFEILAGAVDIQGDRGNSSNFNVTIFMSGSPTGKGNSSNYNVSLGYLYTIDQTGVGLLVVNLSLPPNNTLVVKNSVFGASATVTCRNNECGKVLGFLRHNKSGGVPNISISEALGAIPLFINDSPDGEQLWSYEYDGGGNFDFPSWVATDNQDNVIVVGRIGAAASTDWNVTKLNSDGNQLWSYSYDGGGGDFATSASVDSQDNIVVVGAANGDANVTKLNSDGNQLWSYTYDSGAGDTFSEVAVDSQNNIIAVGTTNNDWNITKLDSNGNQLWSQRNDEDTDLANGVAVDSQDNILVVGQQGNVFLSDWNVTKLNSSGDQLWSYSSNSGEGTGDAPQSVAVDSQDNIVVVGYSGSNWNITKLDSSGDQLWSYRYDTAGTDIAYGVAIDNQDDMIVVGRHEALVAWNVTKLSGGINPTSCSVMAINTECQINWSVNASGDAGTHLALDALFTSNDTKVQSQHTQDHLITIAGAPSITLHQPLNEAIIPISNVTLNATITDDDNSIVDVYVWGANSTDILDQGNNSLLYYTRTTATSAGIVVEYNWTAPIVYPGLYQDGESGTVVVFHFDNRSEFGENDSLLRDFTGLENNATCRLDLNECPSYNFTHSKFGGAMTFDGADDALNLTTDFGTFNNATITVWVNRKNADVDTQGIFSYETAGANNEKINLLATAAIGCTGEAKFQVRSTNGGGLNEICSDSPLINNTWYHIAARCGSGGTSGGMRLFINGIQQAETETHNGCFDDLTGTAIELGKEEVDSHFTGTIDELTIWNRSLSATEIKDLYRLKEGTWYWKVNATDANGNSAENKTFQFSIDVNQTVEECGDLTSPNTVYELTNNVSSPATCFNVLANDITLDCHGFVVNYSQSDIGYGVNITGYNFTTIRSCDVVQGSTTGGANDGAYAIYAVNNVTNTLIFNNSLETFGTEGHVIYMAKYVRNTSINNNTITANGESSIFVSDAAMGIVLESDAYNNSIYDNTITTFGSSDAGVLGGVGILIQTTGYGNFIYDNTIITSGQGGLGVNVLTTAYNNNIYSNTITTSSTNGNGVEISSTAYNNNIYSNTITTSGAAGHGVISSTAYNNNIYSNTITTSGTSGYGMFASADSYNNNIYSNTITTSGDTGAGVYAATSVYNNLIYSNNITTSNTTSYGISFTNNAYNNTIYDNNVTTNNEGGSFGVYLSDNINNNTFYGNRITSLAAGIVISGEGQAAAESTRFNTFTNDTIVPCVTGCSSSYLDVNITDDAQDVIFLNVSFNKSRVRIEEGGNNFTVKWYVDVLVQDTGASPIAGATIMINDTNQLVIYNSTSDSNGRIPTQTIAEYTQNGTAGFNSEDTCQGLNNHNITCFTPYNISVNHTSYLAAASSEDMNRSTFRTFSLTGTTLTILLNSPANDSQVSTQNVTLNTTVTQNNNDLVDIWIWGANSTEQLEAGNSSLLAVYKGVSGTSGGYNVTYNWTAPVVLPDEDMILLLHFDNRSEFGENDSFVFDFSNSTNATCESTFCPVYNFSDQKFGGYLEFDGTNDNITILDRGTDFDAITGKQMTVAFWIKDQDASAAEDILGKVSANTSQWYVRWDNGVEGRIEGCLNRSCATSVPTYDDGRWHHVVFVMDDVADEISLWVDSIKQADTEIYTGQADNDDPFNIGFTDNSGTLPNNHLNSSIDEVAIWTRALSSSEIQNLYRLKEGTWYWKVNATDSLGNSAENKTFQFTLDVTLPIINASINDTTPRRFNTVNLTANVSDEIGVSFCQFIHNGTTGGAKVYENVSISGTSDSCHQIFDVNLSRDNVINFTILVNDTFDNKNQTEFIITVENTPPPAPILFSPNDNNHTFNETPTFVWSNVTDADNDSLIFNLRLLCELCSQDNRDVNVTTLNHTISQLHYRGDDGFFYNWSVRVFDNSSSGVTENGTYSETRNITIDSFVSIIMTTNSVSFGTMNLDDVDNTTDDSPPPFVVENDGNVNANVSIWAEDDMFDSSPNPTNDFMWKIGNTSEVPSFAHQDDNVTIIFRNFTTSSQDAVFTIPDLDYRDANDSAEIEIFVHVPLSEGPGTKSSRVVLEAKAS